MRSKYSRNIREVSPEDIKRDPYYNRGDYTGDLGVEKATKNISGASKAKKFSSAMHEVKYRGDMKTALTTRKPYPGGISL